MEDSVLVGLGTDAHVYVPGGGSVVDALTRATTVGVGAHADDLELGMAFASLGPDGPRSFVGITCTDGAGSARGPGTVGLSDADLVALRQDEQRRAAVIGGYDAIIQLGRPSTVVKTPSGRAALARELAAVLRAATPETVVTHNLADRHATHVGVALAAIEAIRSLPVDQRPRRLLGAEIWRGLDWLSDADKQRLPMTGDPVLARAMARAHASQIDGKAYDTAAEGRRLGNATFDATHALDGAAQVSFAMDMTPLVVDAGLDPADFLSDLVARFRTELVDTLEQLG